MGAYCANGLRAVVTATAVLASGVPSALEAQEPTVPAELTFRERPLVNEGDDGAMTSAAPGGARPVEGEPEVEPEDAALLIPRVVLTPPLVLLNAAFLPLKGLLHVAGRYKIPEHIIDILYNDERTAAVVPTFSFLGSQGPSVGFNAFHGGLGRHRERIGVSAKFGGRYVQSYQVELTAPRVAGTPFGVEVLTSFVVEPHLRFWGYGPGDVREAAPSEPVHPRTANVESVFEQQRALIKMRAGWSFMEAIDLGFIGSFNRRDFGPKVSEKDPEPSVEQVYDTSALPGFENGYSLVEPLLDLRVDTREPKGSTSGGVYFNAFGGGAPPQNGYRFIHYAAEFTGFIDLYHGDRVLALHAAHESVVGDDHEIPFADMPRLGGPKRMRGYDLFRFRDKHTALAVVEYRWPIHEYVAGAAFFEVGSVGRDYETMATPENYRFGGGGGLIFRSQDSELFALQVAYGEGLQVFLTSDALVSFSDRGEQL